MTKDEFCRTCGRKLPARAKEKSPCYPFCSQRCHWVDLGKWFNQEYRLAEGKAPPDARGSGNSDRP
ncbi:MAG: DNA gyrase inhibitor YacG [Actinobacteria bacterium]|nr:DNA gyrase inhibitor YacG [Actinomycetota bacterium]